MPDLRDGIIDKGVAIVDKTVEIARLAGGKNFYAAENALCELENLTDELRMALAAFERENLEGSD